MIKLAANLSLLFSEDPFMDRFAKAAAFGFKGVEILSPYQWPAEDIADALKEHSLTQVLINSAAGNTKNGERGRAAVPGMETAFWDDIQQAIEYANVLNCSQIHVMAGVLNSPEDWDTARLTFVSNLERVAPIAAKHGINLLIEPINDKRDIPGYFLTKIPIARDIITELSHDNIRLQFDFYHAQVMQGDLTTLVLENIDITSHFQISNLPGRCEPSQGEINYPHLFQLLESLDYNNWVGCEYRPSKDTAETLEWAGAYGINNPTTS